MDCPYCGKEMKEGRIPSGTKWLEDGEDSWGGVPLCNSLFGDNPKSFFCPDCRKIILPVPETESVLDQLQHKLGAASKKLSAMREQLEERHSQASEAKRQKEKEKKGKKDPWEL